MSICLRLLKKVLDSPCVSLWLSEGQAGSQRNFDPAKKYLGEVFSRQVVLEVGQTFDGHQLFYMEMDLILTVSHGFYIRWLLISLRCAHME